MPEHLLDAAEVGAALEQVRGERMPEQVRVHLQHYFSFYAVVLSALLIHYYFDHFLFLQVDDVITPRWT